MIKFTLPIEPQSKQRPRAGRGKVYTAKKTRVFESKIKQMTKHFEPVAGPLSLDATFVFKRPKKMSKKLAGRQVRLGVPDVDNLLKALCDGLQGNIVTNDSSFVELTGRKFYAGVDEAPCIEVVVQPYNSKSSPLHARAMSDPKARILESLSQGHTNLAAIQHGLISESTFYRWKRDDPEFNDQVEQATRLGEAKLLEELKASADEKSDWRAYAWLLERKFPNEYGNRQRIEVGPPQEPSIDPRIQAEIEKLQKVMKSR